MTLLRRIAPGLLLVVLAPVIAEFLLGDFTVRSLRLILVLGWQYGCGALLVHEGPGSGGAAGQARCSWRWPMD